MKKLLPATVSTVKPLGLKSIAINLIIFFLSIHFASAQNTDTTASASPQVMYNFYMAKHKVNNTVGWLLLVPGATMMTVRGVINANNGDNFFKHGFNPAEGDRLGLLGGVMAFTSIHFFISAGSNKRKASLSLKREKVPFGDKGPGKYQFTALVLKIKL